MFSETSPQSSLFEVEHYFPGALPGNDWSFIYQARILPLIDEQKFRHLYSESEGRPDASIRTMVSLLIFMGTDALTWRAVEFQFPRRIDWLIATRTPLGHAFIDHTTLFTFYQRLDGADTAKNFFVDITDVFLKTCGTSLQKQRTDSFFIHGWLRILSRYGLFKAPIRKFLLSLHTQKPGVYANVKGQLSREYLEKEFDLTEKDRDLAQRKISLMAQDLYRLSGAFAHHHPVKHYETFKLLCTVFSQQCEVTDAADSDPDIIIKEKPDTDTVCSPHNPEVRYVRKVHQRVTGDKGFVTETCDDHNKTQFITDVAVTDATEHDSHEHPRIQLRLTEHDFKPDTQYADAGFVNGQTILDSQDNGIELEGPTAGRSQSPAAYTDEDRPFDAGDFAIRLDETTNTVRVTACPDNQTPTEQKQSKKTGRRIVHFRRDTCIVCPQLHRCPVKIGRRVATFKVGTAEYVGAARHHRYMSDRA